MFDHVIITSIDTCEAYAVIPWDVFKFPTVNSVVDRYAEQYDIERKTIIGTPVKLVHITKEPA